MSQSSLQELFLIEQYKSLKQETQKKHSDQKELRKNIVFAVGALYAIAATLDVEKVSQTLRPLSTVMIWWAPVILVFLAWRVYRSDINDTILIGKFIVEKYERKYLGSNDGWEEYYKANGSHGVEHDIFWALTIFFTFVIALTQTWSAFKLLF